MSKHKWTVACDFDGVINSYTTKWERADLIPDPPMPGAFEWLTDIVKNFKVVIYSARFTPHDNTEGGWDKAQVALESVRAWFRTHGLPEEVLEQLEFWMDPGKPTALIYIDDRGYRFKGRFPSRSDIHLLRPWKVTDGRE